HEETAEAADAPEGFEIGGGKLAEIDALVDAGVVDDQVGGLAALDGRHRAVEESRDVFFACGIPRDGFGATARGADRAHDLGELLRRAAVRDDVVSAGREAPAERGAEP